MSSSSGQSQGMQMYGGTGQNSRSGGSSFGQGVSNQPWLENLYNNAGNLFGSQSSQMNGMMPGAINFQNQQAQGAANANKGMQQGGVYGGLGIGNQLMNSLQQSQNTPSNMQQVNSMIMGGNGNTSLDALKGSLEANAARSNQLNSATNTAQAAASGMSGGSRQGVMDSLNQDNTNRNLQATEADLGYKAFDTDLNRKLNIAQQADTNTMGRQQLMSGMLGQQQGAVNQGIQNTGAVQGYGMGQFNAANQPWQQMQGYQGAIGGPNVLNSGSSYNQGQGTNTSWGGGQNSGSTKGGGLL
jgi:hypothetical protein